jgi:hypothetical protein
MKSMNFKNFKATSGKNVGIQGREADKSNVRCNNTRVSTLQSFRLYYASRSDICKFSIHYKHKIIRRLLLL